METSPLARGPDRWKYVQRLVDRFPVGESFWDGCSDSLCALEYGVPRTFSFDELRSEEVLTEIVDYRPQRSLGGFFLLDRPKPLPVSLAKVALGLTKTEIGRFSDTHRRRIFAGRKPMRPRWVDEIHFAIDWQRFEDQYKPAIEINMLECFECDLKDSNKFCVYVDRPYPGRDFVLLNPMNALGTWMLRIWEADDRYMQSVTPERKKSLLAVFERAVRLYGDAIHDLSQHLSGWSAMETLPQELVPPVVDVTESMFMLPSPHSKKLAKKREAADRRKAPKGRKASKTRKTPKARKTPK
jgi:hypothetical protein